MNPTRTGDSGDDLRPLLFSIAYEMLGTVGDAEDIVQEAFLRLEQSVQAGTIVRSVRGYLTTVTARLAIDELRSARVRREEYFGPWLPEPLVAGAELDPALFRSDRHDVDPVDIWGLASISDSMPRTSDVT